MADKKGAFEGAAAIGSMRVDCAACAVQCSAGLYQELSPVFFVDFEAHGFQGEGFLTVLELDVIEECAIAAESAFLAKGIGRG